MRTITNKNKHLAVAYLTIAQRKMSEVKEYEKYLAEVLEIPDSGDGYYGYVSDAVWEGHI